MTRDELMWSQIVRRARLLGKNRAWIEEARISWDRASSFERERMADRLVAASRVIEAALAGDKVKP
jgi:hypothetical protein